MYIFYTQIGALFDAIKNIAVKHQKNNGGYISSLTFTWGWLIFTLLILLPLALKDGIPNISDDFYVALAARVILDPLAIYLYNYSIQNFKISSVLPLLSFGPAFSYIVGIFLIGEIPSVLATFGIFFIIIGVYFLNLQKGMGFLHPFSQIFKNKGNLYVIIAAVIWGTLVPFFKMGNKSSSTLFYTGISSLGVTIVFTAIIFIFRRNEIKKVILSKKIGVFVGLGVLDSLVLTFRMVALETGKAAVVSALNRTSIIFGAFIGGLLFKERIKSKIIPTFIMIAGVVLIVLR